MQEMFSVVEVMTDKEASPVDLRYLSVNPTFERMSMNSRDVIVGHTYRELVPNPDPEWIALVAKVAITGGPMLVERYSRITRRWTQVHCYSPRHGQCASLSIDITDRKRAEEALEKSQQLFSSTFRTNPAATILSLLVDGRCVDANEAYANLVGYTREELIGKTTVELNIWISAEERQRLVTELAQKGHLENTELTLRKKNGDIINTVASGEVFTLDGQQYLLFFFFDITKRKRTEESLQERTLALQRLTETLEEHVKERTAEIADLSSRLLSVQETERKRISYDLHDHVWQNLGNVNLMLKRFFSGGSDESLVQSQEEVHMIISRVEETIEKIRMMQGDLWPYVMDDLGILAALRWYCREFEKVHSDLHIDTQINIVEEEVPISVKIIIYRVMQEAMRNISKHSQATRALLTLRKDRGRVELSITDNGVGFDFESLRLPFETKPWTGLGLMGMRERVRQSGGTFDLNSSPKNGTTISAVWPI